MRSLLLIMLIVLSACNANTPNALLETTTTTDTEYISFVEAVKLIESKLDKETLRVSSLTADGQDSEGNYVITQSSKATTVVMEWYHVNPYTQVITCEIIGGMCLDEEDINDPQVGADVELSSKQIQALELAKEFARSNFTPEENGYIEDLTYIEFDHEENDEMIFHVYNPGPGSVDTIDWITVNLKTNKVQAMLNQK